MLEEFFVDNYKSLINVTFRPTEQNLLIGMNNAGKTNLCQAAVFLSATARFPIDKCAEICAGARSGITNFYFAKPAIDFRARATIPFEDDRLIFEYALTISARSTSPGNPLLEVEQEKLSVTCKGFDGVALLENTRERVRLLHESDYLQQRPHYVEMSAPRDATMLSRLYDLKTNPRANCFRRYLNLWQYYVLTSQSLREFRHDPNDCILYRHGNNLASVVYQLKTRNERAYRRLLTHLRGIDPRIDVINFNVPSEDVIVMFFEDKKGNRLLAANASAGTLRFLALAYLLLAQPALDQSPMIIIEEPENGIYVGFLKELLGLVEEAPNRPQLIFTSHSPYFIDLFDNRLEGVFVLKPGEQHSSLTQPDVQKVKARLQKYPLGEQHFREMLR